MQNKSLIDPFNRQIRYLRLSVTDRCNLRCTYCMAEDMEFLPRSKVLSLEEMVTVSAAFVRLGVKKIRLTGGEPLVRRGIVDLAAELNKLPGLELLAMTTNGVLLPDYAKELYAAGLRRLNISLDSLRPQRFRQLTRFGELEQVLQGIDAAIDAGFTRVKINAVILKDINDDEILDLCDFVLGRGLDISFIEEMPLGEIDSHVRSNSQYSSASVKSVIEQQYSLTAEQSISTIAGPSRYHRIGDTQSRVGFISPLSHNFCDTCNRVRVTTEGKLILCLGNDDAVDLKSIIRQQSSDPAAIEQAIREAMTIKPERHHFDPAEIRVRRHMSATGG